MMIFILQFFHHMVVLTRLACRVFRACIVHNHMSGVSAAGC